jgi:hypothetical protein
MPEPVTVYSAINALFVDVHFVGLFVYTTAARAFFF